MAGRGEISWKEKSSDGDRQEKLVRRQGREWVFFRRAKRHDRWQPLPEPTLEDWRKLLDGVERRVGRHLCRPEEPSQVRELIRRRFPEAEP